MATAFDPERSKSYEVILENPRMLTMSEDLAAVRAAASKGNPSAALQMRMAGLLLRLDHFDEAIDVLGALEADSSSFTTRRLLAQAHMSRENRDDDAMAVRWAEKALERAETRGEQAQMTGFIGKMQARQGELDQARETLLAALEISPTDNDAYKRLATLDLDAGRTQEALDFAEQMMTHGIKHSRLLAVRAIALARLGRRDEALVASGMQYLHHEMLIPPAGWESADAFNRALVEELRAHPGIRYNRYGVASTQSWRIDEPCLARSRIMKQLRLMIKQAAESYAASLPTKGHPWLEARIPSGHLHHWAVLTDGEGFEEWHVHQNGWMSGAYYAHVPDFIVEGDGKEGCIAFGLPGGPGDSWADDGHDSLIVRPQTGLLLLFPSHTFHRTYPHHGDSRRVCVSFDISPEDLGPGSR